MSSSILEKVLRFLRDTEGDEIEAGKRFHLASFLQELKTKIDACIAQTDAYRPRFPAVISGCPCGNLDFGLFTRY